MELTSPSVWNLGVGYTYDAKNKIYFNASYTDWSVVKDLVLKTDVDVWQDPTAIAREAEYYVSRTDLNYQDSRYIALGLEHQYDPLTMLRFGLASEGGVALDSYRTPRTPDADRQIISLGVGRSFGLYQLDLGFAHYRFANSKLNLAGGPPNNTGRGNLSADIKGSANVLMIGVSYVPGASGA